MHLWGKVVDCTQRPKFYADLVMEREPWDGASW